MTDQSRRGRTLARFAERLHEVIWRAEALNRLNAYLASDAYTGSRFDTYGGDRKDSLNITGDDLIAVTMLSIEIKAKTPSGITPEAALLLEDRGSEINALLNRLPDHAELHRLAQSEATTLLFSPQSPGIALYDIVFDALKGPGTRKRVATSKLLARKRPNLFPIRDKDTASLLGNPTKWWEPWWEALSGNPARCSAPGRPSVRSGRSTHQPPACCRHRSVDDFSESRCHLLVDNPPSGVLGVMSTSSTRSFVTSASRRPPSINMQRRAASRRLSKSWTCPRRPGVACGGPHH